MGVERSTPEQSLPNLILASALAVDTAITEVFGLKVERRSMPRDNKRRGTQPFKTQISF